MGLFGPKKTAQQKYNEKEAQQLKRKYENDIKAFESGLSSSDRELFRSSVAEIISKCRPYEHEAGRPRSLDTELDYIAWKLQNASGPQACMYAYVLFAEQMPDYATYFQDLILGCDRREKERG